MATPQVKVATRPAAKQSAPRERIDVRRTVGGIRVRVGHGWRLVADTTADGARTVGSFSAGRARSVAGWRLPSVNPYLGAAITGAVVGVGSVVLGVLSLSIFDAVRGVSSGGGLWGGLAFTAIAVVAAFSGEALLRGFGSTSARLTSFLAVVLVIIAMLGLFLDVADTAAALFLLPLLGVAAFALSRWLVDIAENAPPEID